ncbi:MAG TPA: hypothetical protein VN445_12120 [Rectinemataceae bacterium]|nr:hypothetical protein [Rectinemataceae bacterium]
MKTGDTEKTKNKPKEDKKKDKNALEKCTEPHSNETSRPDKEEGPCDEGVR